MKATPKYQTAEHQRLLAHRKRQANWRNWGPYLSERAWGTVREDYSANGDAWRYFSHADACSRAYRWNEDGLAGISDRNQYLCFALALWNGHDKILKERLFGLTGPEGNHGEDVKEYYFYLDSTPTHSYMKMVYKYPQGAFPYSELMMENHSRGYTDPEYELLDTGIFDENRYFDVEVEYAKADQNDILIQISVTNCGPNTARCTVLPTLWCRNTWGWGYSHGPMGNVAEKPILRLQKSGAATWVEADHPVGGPYWLYAEAPHEWIFTENESNNQILFNTANASPYVKDAFHRYIVHGQTEAINPRQVGTKSAAVFLLEIAPNQTEIIRLRLTDTENPIPFDDFAPIFQKRIAEADSFYAAVQNPQLSPENRAIQRQALAGMLWSKQLYYYDIEQWLKGDPLSQPPEARKLGRNKDWKHLTNFDIISMPDKWEYPWYATWDSAFHCLPLALVDPDFAKRQLTLFTRVWYTHPNGQFPAYEWAFGDANPPVHAWAAWRVYKMDARETGQPDRDFLEGIFHALLINFTWWTNRKDKDDNNIFQGGFLGLDNISVFNRSEASPVGGHIDQADGTAWMAAYCLNMLKIALELAAENPVYEDIATKFFEHFLRIAHAMSNLGEDGYSLWDEEDQFFYDALHIPGQPTIPLKVRSMVGLLPLFAVETLDTEHFEQKPKFYRRSNWFIQNRPHLSGNIADIHKMGQRDRHLLSILTKTRLVKVLEKMLDENEFLSDYGIRSLSKYHQNHPYRFEAGGHSLEVTYWPAEAQSGLFGGNSNWRGPIWFPINFLIIEALQKYHHFYGNDLKVQFPTGSGNWLNLSEVAAELSRRLMRLFQTDQGGRRPIYANAAQFDALPGWNEHILFYEYFNGDTGAGLGASHQTGWTGLVAKLIQQIGE